MASILFNIMKKIVFVLLVMAFPFSMGYAQEVPKRKVQAVEVEVAGGIGIGLNKMGFDQNHLAYTFRIEPRYNFPSGAFDIGFGTQFVRLDRSSLEPRQDYTSPSFQFYVVGDYNWRINNQLTLFCGIAAGVSWWTQTSSYSAFGAPDKWSPYIGPRIGLEAWDRLRFTVSLNLMNKETSFVGFNLGYAFGGKPLK